MGRDWTGSTTGVLVAIGAPPPHDVRINKNRMATEKVLMFISLLSMKIIMNWFRLYLWKSYDILSKRKAKITPSR
jgi:hypothetical protein